MEKREGKEITISVIIPLYNGAKSIIKCIDSLEAQTIQYSYEVLIVDDASTDKSADIVENYINHLKHKDIFKIIRCGQNGRAGTARNIGIEKSNAEYIVFIDQDDYPNKNFLEELYKLTEDGKFDCVSCDILDRNGREYHRYKLGRVEHMTLCKKKELLSDFGYIFAILIKRSVLIRNGLKFAEKVMFEDILFNYGLASCIESYNGTDKILYYRTMDENSQTAYINKMKINERISAVKKYREIFESNKNISELKDEISSEEFFYLYLSNVRWMLLNPALFDQELFEICLKEGRMCNPKWDTVSSDKRFQKSMLIALKILYDYPITVKFFRIIGILYYSLKKIVKKRGNIK